MILRHKAIFSCILGLCISACAETSVISNTQPELEVEPADVRRQADLPPKPVQEHAPKRCTRQFLPTKQEQLCQRLICAEKNMLNSEIDILLPEFEFNELKFKRLSEKYGSNKFGLICYSNGNAIGQFQLSHTVSDDRIKRSLLGEQEDFLASGTLSKVRIIENKRESIDHQNGVEGNISFTRLAPLSKR